MGNVVRKGNLSICTECGAVRASLAHHDCESAVANHSQSETPSATEREARRKEDSGKLETIVKTTSKSPSSGAYAYHEISNDGKAICNPGDSDTELEAMTREEAQDRGKCPCQMCQRILE